MISNELNIIDGPDDPKKELKQIGNRIKTLRMKAGYMNYEVFAYRADISRNQFRRNELGFNLNMTSLLRVLSALEVTLPEFFSEGFD